MNLTDVPNTRLINQQLERSRFKAVKELVGWMGGMQAQDFGMAKWAIGIRLTGATDKSIETAIDNGEILRTHALRTTWHFVSADDIYWMLALRADPVKAGLRSRHNQLGLSESIIAKSNATLEEALRGGKHLTREELAVPFGEAGIALNENRFSHLMLRAEMDGVVCSGASKGGKLTYARLEEWVPRTKPIPKEEAIAKLARIYFRSHGPATWQDFAWWSGFSAADAKEAVEALGAEFISETTHAQTYWFNKIRAIPRNDKDRAYLLPAFDEYIISYKDRQTALPLADFNKTVSNNGIFRPVIVVNGQVVGIWKRTIKKEKVLVETELFQPIDQATKGLIEEAARQYGKYLEKETEFLSYV